MCEPRLSARSVRVSPEISGRFPYKTALPRRSAFTAVCRRYAAAGVSLTLSYIRKRPAQLVM